jgi:hypothetical protein
MISSSQLSLFETISMTLLNLFKPSWKLCHDDRLHRIQGFEKGGEAKYSGRAAFE